MTSRPHTPPAHTAALTWKAAWALLPPPLPCLGDSRAGDCPEQLPRCRSGGELALPLLPGPIPHLCRASLTLHSAHGPLHPGVTRPWGQVRVQRHFQSSN